MTWLARTFTLEKGAWKKNTSPQHSFRTLLCNTPPQHFSITLLYNTSLQHFSTKLLDNTSLQHFSTSLFHNTSWQHFSRTRPHNTSPQHLPTTLPHNTFLQHLSTTLLHNTALQRCAPTLLPNTSLLLSNTSPRLLYNTSPQHFSTTLHHNTSLRHASLQDFAPALLDNTSLQHFSRTLLYKTSLQRFSSTSCETSSIFDSFETENRRFYASFSYKAILTKLKKHEFREASTTLQGAHKMLRLPRFLTPRHVRHVCAALTIRFTEKTHSPRQKVLRLPRENSTLILTRPQSIAPWHCDS